MDCEFLILDSAFPVTLLYTAVKAQTDMLEALRKEGRFTEAMVATMVSHETYGKICGAKILQAFAKRYGLPEAGHGLTATDYLSDRAYEKGKKPIV